MSIAKINKKFKSIVLTDEYFICSVGNVSEKTLKEYIENQG